MKIQNVIIGALMALVMLAGLVMAEDISGEAVNAGFSSTPCLKMIATPNSITLDNSGTAPIDVGGLKIVVKDGSVGREVAKMPFTKILTGNPYPFARDPYPWTYKCIVQTTETLTPGTVVILTNGVGTWAKATVQ
jgi:hypothetical protein